MRDRLIELIQGFALSDEPCPEGLFEWADTIADHLLAEGVIVPPVKAGQTVYVMESENTGYWECKIINFLFLILFLKYLFLPS